MIFLSLNQFKIILSHLKAQRASQLRLTSMDYANAIIEPKGVINFVKQEIINRKKEQEINDSKLEIRGEDSSNSEVTITSV
ncbi:MAG: hypothetical protein ARM1_0614 [Candidatus Micrarchaeota archaeon]|nr:MAG: hypothetical protein ARM1_0614 [Candidatus Micrarchaeota archaeon]